MSSVPELRAAIENESPQERERRLARAARDPARPRYHFLPRRPAWINDPNGTIYWNGLYHLFFQYNPDKPFHGSIHWGHAVSADLVHWEERPIALRPEPGGTDAEGCWSGCALDAAGVPMLFYTGVHPEVQIGAVGDESLNSWRKIEPNPLIGAPPEGIEPVGFRDPCVWRAGADWRMLVGTGIPDEGGTAFLYRSEDLRRWECLHLFYPPEPEREMHECPDLFPLGDRWALLTSWKGVFLDVGQVVDDQFMPEWRGRLDYGRFYAPRTFQGDRKGRRIVVGWVQEDRSVEEQIQAGWSGVISLPRVLDWNPKTGLRMAFVPELHALRTAERHAEQIRLRSEHRLWWSGPASGWEWYVRFGPGGSADRIGVVVEDFGPLLLDRRAGRLAEAPFILGEDEPLEMHLYGDRSVLEVIVNGRWAMTLRSYRRPDGPKALFLVAEGGSAQVERVSGWTLGG